MRAIAINEFGGRDKLQPMELPRPEPADDEVLVQIKAAGVNPVDWKIREGMLKDRLPHEFPLILGWDAAGVVVGRGQDANRLSEGDEVFAYCRKPVVKDGAYAEFIALPEDNVVLKPKSMPIAEAATVPLAALTAYQALFDAGKLKAHETVLIQAAAGGVGTFAIQLAKDCGARALGTASEGHHEYLLELGIDVHIDYKAGDFREATRAACPDGVDLVFDCVGGDTLQASADIIKPDGRVVSITDPSGVDELAKKGVDAGFVFVEPIRAELESIAEMIDGGKLRTYISASLRLDEAAKAHELSESKHTRGKIVLSV
jgi:NADPH2:quinone reductase